MNLYIFNDNNCASNYGIGTYLKELTEALENTSIHVHIVHLRSVRPEFEIVKINQAEHWYIPEIRNGSTISGAITKVEDYFRNVSFLLRLHIKDTNDLVFHFNFNICQSLVKELKIKFNCKTAVTIHYLKWTIDLRGNFLKFQEIKLKPENLQTKFEQTVCKIDAYEKALFREADRLAVLSQAMKNLLINEYQIKRNMISVIPNGLADARPEFKADREVLKRKWIISESEFVILFAGRLHHDKGIIHLIQSFRKVLEIIPSCRLMIAGNGNYDSCIQEAKDICTKVAFAGLLEKEELYELYRLADIGVITSFHEQCSYVAIEMMMHGVPMIVSAAAGLNEMVEEGVNGLYVPIIENDEKMEIDVTLLSDKIIYLYHNGKERKRMGKNAQKRYKKRYSAETFRNNMLDFYESLILEKEAVKYKTNELKTLLL